MLLCWRKGEDKSATLYEFYLFYCLKCSHRDTFLNILWLAAILLWTSRIYSNLTRAHSRLNKYKCKILWWCKSVYLLFIFKFSFQFMQLQQYNLNNSKVNICKYVKLRPKVLYRLCFIALQQAETLEFIVNLRFWVLITRQHQTKGPESILSKRCLGTNEWW